MLNKNRIFFLLFLLFFLAGCATDNISNTNDTASYHGQELLFVKDAQVYAADTDGLNSINVSAHDGNNFFPAWLKEKEVILFVSEKDGFYGIWQKNLLNNDKNLLWGSKLAPKFISLSPDHNWLIYAEEQTCFLFNINTKNAQEITDACDHMAWSDQSRSFIYQEGETIYFREFNIKQELSVAKELYKGLVFGTIFLDQKNLIFETKDIEPEATKYDLYKFSLDTKVLTPVTNLDFSGTDEVNLQLSPNSTQLIYNRVDSATKIPSAWLVNISQTPALAKLVLNNAQEIIWQPDSAGFYYVINELDEESNNIPNIFRASKDGLNKEKIQDHAEQIAI